MCRRSQELRKRQVENSPLLAILALCPETELGQRTPSLPNAAPIVLEVSTLVLIESAAVWRFCWA